MVDVFKNNYLELFCIVVGLIGIYYSIRGFVLLKKSASWEKTQGYIQNAEVIFSGELDYFPRLKYSYIVNGKTYSSKRIYPSGIMLALSKEDAQEEIESFGSNLTVYYDPKNPKNSCLKPEQGYPGIILICILALIFFIGGFYSILNKI